MKVTEKYEHGSCRIYIDGLEVGSIAGIDYGRRYYFGISPTLKQLNIPDPVSPFKPSKKEAKATLLKILSPYEQQIVKQAKITKKNKPPRKHKVKTWQNEIPSEVLTRMEDVGDTIESLGFEGVITEVEYFIDLVRQGGTDYDYMKQSTVQKWVKECKVYLEKYKGKGV